MDVKPTFEVIEPFVENDLTRSSMPTVASNSWRKDGKRDQPIKGLQKNKKKVNPKDYKTKGIEEFNSIIHMGSKILPGFANRIRYGARYQSVLERENTLRQYLYKRNK